MTTLKKNYYVGVLLSASRNPLNKIQFFARKKKGGSVDLFSRTNRFNSTPDTGHMNYVGSFHNMEELTDTINSSRQEMADRGLSVPGTKLYKLERN